MHFVSPPEFYLKSMLYNFLNNTPRNEEVACKQFGEQAIWHTEDYFRNPQEKKIKPQYTPQRISCKT